MDLTILVWIFIGIAVALAVLNIVSFIRALINKRKAERKLAELDDKIETVKGKLEARKKELEAELKKTINRLKGEQK
jgi:uncharacterized membrane-anchored protein YhcB (DUF1043 family)